SPGRAFGSTRSEFSRATQLNESVADMSSVKMQLEEMLSPQVQQNTVRIQEDGRGVTVSLAEAGFFDSGAAVVNPAGLVVLERIAQKLHDLPQDIRVEGHTDTTPIHN